MIPPSQRWRPRLWKTPCMNRKTRIVIVVALLQTYIEGSYTFGVQSMNFVISNTEKIRLCFDLHEFEPLN